MKSLYIPGFYLLCVTRFRDFWDFLTRLVVFDSLVGKRMTNYGHSLFRILYFVNKNTGLLRFWLMRNNTHFYKATCKKLEYHYLQLVNNKEIQRSRASQGKSRNIKVIETRGKGYYASYINLVWKSQESCVLILELFFMTVRGWGTPRKVGWGCGAHFPKSLH